MDLCHTHLLWFTFLYQTPTLISWFIYFSSGKLESERDRKDDCHLHRTQEGKFHVAFCTSEIPSPFVFSLLTYGLDISAGSNSWRRTRLLCDHTAGESQCDSYRHIWRSQNGHGILTCCLWRCSCHHQRPQLHPQNIPRLLWSPPEIYKALTSSFK